MSTDLLDKIKPINHEKIKFNDRFWAPRIQINREQTIPFQYEQCKITGRLDVLNLDWKPGQEPKPHPFWDSDIGKWIEAASYSLATHYDKELDSLLDHVIQKLVAAQRPDGYLNTYFTVVKPGERWTDLRDAHELYCAGHLIEAGVAHYEATGKKSLLNVVCTYADYIDSVFGKDNGKKRGYPGHQEIEIALVKLYRVTKEERYLKLSQFFIDERGQKPHYFDIEEEERGNTGYFGHIAKHFGSRKEYNQSHKPVREQDEAVGHSVRAMYMYSAMADLAYELDDHSLIEACERLWEDVYTKKMYITGGIGSSGSNEGFAKSYDLPNRSYAETCAAIGLVFWNHRMLQLNCDRRYSDLLEHVLYNGVMSGVSLDGKKYFYANPLASKGDLHRREWYGVACCPPNLARLLASLGQYVYSYDEENVIVHLFIQSSSEFTINDETVNISQKTNYPWDSKVKLVVDKAPSINFGLKIRIPKWCKHASVHVNDEIFDFTELDLDKGYLKIDRIWEDGDVVGLEFPMPVSKVYSHPNVSQAVGKIVLKKGPIIYCLEGVDHQTELYKIFLPKTSHLTSQYDENLLGGVNVIEGEALKMDESGWGNALYDVEKPQMKKTTIKAIPYYAWDNREPGEMVVWINEAISSNS